LLMREHVAMAFEGDNEILEYYDSTVEVSTVDQVVDDIYRKLLEYDALFEFYFIPVECGYFSYIPGYAISFGRSVKNRDAKRLQKFWQQILEQLGGTFECALWTKNTRAINWLKKMGMVERQVIDYKGHSITILCL